MSTLYRLIPLRALRRTNGVKFDEMVPSDIPKIHGIDRVIHKPNSISPGPVDNIKRPWYMHPGQDDNLMVLQGTRYIDILTMTSHDLIFFLFECFMFFLPVIPSNPYVRYCIAALYFLSHRYRVQYYYASTKRHIIEKNKKVQRYIQSNNS